MFAVNLIFLYFIKISKPFKVKFTKLYNVSLSIMKGRR